MTTTTIRYRSPEPATPPRLGVQVRLGFSRARWSIGLIALAALSLALTTTLAGSAISDYYASVAISMSKSASNFWFGALDPGGTVSHDKIPGALWIPAILIHLFGYSPAMLIIPNALAATASAIVVAITARRLTDDLGGLLAGLLFTTTPIVIAAARTNQPESMFALFMTLAAWGACHAVTRKSLLWLCVSGSFIALAFHMYMIQAWAAWPAIAVGYLATSQPWLRKVWHLAVSGVISLALSLTWVIATSLTPREARPFVGSTLTNSAWELVFGYNAAARFSQGGQGEAGSDFRIYVPTWSGEAGVFRLLGPELATQVGWLFYASGFGVFVLFALRLWLRTAVVVLLAAWFASFSIMYSVVAGMHQFTSAALAIPMALIVAIAFSIARRRNIRWAQAGLVAITALQAVSFSIYYPGLGYPLPIAVAQLLAAVAAFGATMWMQGTARLALVLSVVALTFSPFAWSVATVVSNSGPNNPVAGGMPDGTWSLGAENFRPIAWKPPGEVLEILADSGADEFDVAVFSGSTAGSLLRANPSLRPLAVGGFMGVDGVPSFEDFRSLTADGSLRYVIVRGLPAQGLSINTDAIVEWVSGTCTPLSIRGMNVGEIYDCAMR